MNDTLKKPRKLLSASYALRYPDLVAKSKNPVGEVDLDTFDPAVNFSVLSLELYRLIVSRSLNMTDSVC